MQIRCVLAGLLLGGLLLSGCEGEVTQAPVAVKVNGLSQTKGAVGAGSTLQIACSGLAFSSSLEVLFGTTAAVIESYTETTIRVKVPATLAPGQYTVKVLVDGTTYVATQQFEVGGARYLLAGDATQGVWKIDLTKTAETAATALTTTDATTNGVYVAVDDADRLLFYNAGTKLYRYNLATNTPTELGVIGNVSGLEADDETNRILIGAFATGYSLVRMAYTGTTNDTTALYRATESDASFYQQPKLWSGRRLFVYQQGASMPYYVRAIQLEGPMSGSLIAQYPNSTVSSYRLTLDARNDRIFRLRTTIGENPVLERATTAAPNTWTTVYTFNATTYGSLLNVTALWYDEASGCLYIADPSKEAVYGLEVDAASAALRTVCKGKRVQSLAGVSQ